MSRLKALEGRPVNSKKPFKGLSSRSNVGVKVEGPGRASLKIKKALQGFVSSGSNVRVEVEGPSKGGLSTQKSPSRVQVLEAKYYMSRLKALEGLF